MTRVCVLGAGGAIGARLVQALDSEGYEVIAGFRQLRSAARVARTQVTLKAVDIAQVSPKDLAKVFEGVDFVVDCTFSSQSSVEQSVAESTRMASTILTACELAKVQGVIHFGTISVYPFNAQGVDETTACRPKGDAYADGKLAAETLFVAPRSNLSTVVLQLPIVMGPFMGWTKSLARQITAGQLLLPDEINGACDPLHVDDVVLATQQTIKYLQSKSNAGTLKLLIPGRRSLPWNDVYQAFASRIAHPSRHPMTTTRMRYQQLAQGKKRELRPWTKFKRQFSRDDDFRQLILSQWGIRTVYRLWRRLRGESGIERLKTRLSATSQSNLSPSQTLLPPATLATLESLPKINSGKAQETIGFQAQYSIEQICDDANAWLRWAGFIEQ